ncbi:hypothetical protein AgCh_023874 [Apium graveolens]
MTYREVRKATRELREISTSQIEDMKIGDIDNKKTGEVALKGARKGSLFVAYLDSTNKDGICYFYTKALEEQSKIWHKKLSHLNFKAINTLVKKELLRDMPKLEIAQVESWVEFIYSKDETPHIIIEHIKKMKNQAEDYNCVKRLRSDNGTEFRNAILSGFCKSKDIVQGFSASRTPQQNGVVERKNRTLVEVARTMLQDVRLPTNFWEEAVNTACYTQNIYLINKAHGK